MEIMPPVTRMALDRRIGGLENMRAKNIRLYRLDRRIGGLEIEKMKGIASKQLDRRIGGLEISGH